MSGDEPKVEAYDVIDSHVSHMWWLTVMSNCYKYISLIRLFVIPVNNRDLRVYTLYTQLQHTLISHEHVNNYTTLTHRATEKIYMFD